MKQAIFGLLLTISVFGFAQKTPQVPSKMQLADMKLIITDGAKKDIQKDIDMLRASDKFFRIKLDRVVLYMELVEQILKEENIPEDIKYLAIQESSFIPDAVSTSKAVGFWQFKDFTAREVGMRVDGKIDERKNIVSSTIGAARYFRSHQKQLDNWAHTITAHMTGGAGIKKYVSANDYGAKKMTITKKSHWYLKRFLAHKIAFEHELDHVNSKGLELLAYKKGAGKDLGKIAGEFKVDEDKLKAYNKWLIHGRIPGDKRYVVMVPVQRGNRKARRLAEASEVPPRKQVQTSDPVSPSGAEVKGPVYPGEELLQDQATIIRVNRVKAIIAREGEDFVALLKRSGLKEKKFLKFNDLGNRPKVEAGDVFFIKKKKGRSKVGFHVVQPGEALWEVSQKYGMRLASLLSKNRMSIQDIPKSGRVLWLSTSRPARIPVEYQELVPDEHAITSEPKKDYSKSLIRRDEPRSGVDSQTDPVQGADSNSETAPMVDTRNFSVYRIKAGDTLWQLAKSYGCSVDELLKWNKLKSGVALALGQEILVPKNSQMVHNEPKKETRKRPSKRKNSRTHIVRGGETLYGISKKYNMGMDDLLAKNGLNKGATLSVGQELLVVSEESDDRTTSVSKSTPKERHKTHTVQAGETLYGIARSYEVELDDLLKWNKMRSGAELAVGQELAIKDKSQNAKAEKPQEESQAYYTVQPGDTLYGIARKYNMDVAELKKLNKIKNNSLAVGDQLKVK